MTTFQQLQLMHLVAELYYTANRTQDEIAAELSISRQKVSRLLAQARDEGIVQITINDPFSIMPALSSAIREALGLTTVIVTPGKDRSQAQIRKHLGYAAARYLETGVQVGDMVGIGWGRTLSEVVHSLRAGGDRALTVVPLLGGLSQISPGFQVHELARILSDKFGGVWKPFYVPAIVEHEDICRSLYRSNDVRQMVQSWDNLTVVLVGIGNVDLGPDVRMLFADYMDDKRMAHLHSLRAVGDICMRFFDIEGKPIPDGLPGVVGIDLEQLRRAKLRIGVAGGAEKTDAILGAVRGGYINALITDESAALQILERLDSDRA
ncbi:MAG: sugar-binding transcriptional regulator [Caldilineaceae bacterium]|nr:sugar-binding transcriptional regulator [Caldilineaceae bacterium]